MAKGVGGRKGKGGKKGLGGKGKGGKGKGFKGGPGRPPKNKALIADRKRRREEWMMTMKEEEVDMNEDLEEELEGKSSEGGGVARGGSKREKVSDKTTVMS